MKKIILILLALTFVFTNNAQKLLPVKNDLSYEKLLPKHKTYKQLREQIWVQDSTKHFNYNTGTGEWEPVRKSKVTQRLLNGRDGIVEILLFDDDEWKNNAKIELFYDYTHNIINGIDNLDKLLFNVWDNNTLSWRTDTVFYVDFTNYMDIPEFPMWGNIREDIYIEKNWNNATNQYTEGTKLEYTLVSDSLYSLISIYGYNTATYDFDLEGKYELNYEIMGGENKITSGETKRWDGSVYNNYRKFFFAYVNNNMVQQILQQWNSDLNLWENRQRTEKTYDASNYVTSEIKYNWDGTTWEKDWKAEFENDLSNGNILSETKYDWNSSTNEWEGDFKKEYTYNVDNFMLTQISYFWSSGTWYYAVKNIYEYNSNNEEVLKLQTQWDGTNWINSLKIITSYNVFGDIEQSLHLNWDGSAWENSSRYVYNYDSNQNLTEKLHQFWSTPDNDWINDYKDESYWNLFEATFVNTLQNTHINIYPNPTTDFINIHNTKNKINSVTITNVSGKVVYNNTKLNSKNNFISMKKYGKGIFFVNITDEIGNKTQSKIVVR